MSNQTLIWVPCRGSLHSDDPILDVFPSYLILPACSVHEPVTSPITSSLQEDADYRPPPSPATMDQYLSGEGDLLLGDTADLPLQAADASSDHC